MSPCRSLGQGPLPPFVPPLLIRLTPYVRSFSPCSSLRSIHPCLPPSVLSVHPSSRISLCSFSLFVHPSLFSFSFSSSILQPFLSSYLPFFLPSFLSSFLSSFLPSVLPFFPSSFRPSFFHSFLSSFLNSFLPFVLPS